MKVIDISTKGLKLSVPKSYKQSVIYKCFYWYTKDYEVTIDELSSEFLITLEIIEGQLMDDKQLLAKIKRDLLDFKLRSIVDEETRNLRELITAKAFAHYNIENEDIIPPNIRTVS